MIAKINNFEVDLSKPIDISIPLINSDENPIAWYLEKPIMEPVVFGDWIGKVSEGSSTNFNNIYFNPHGHGTHTECLGHITREFYSINQALKQFFFLAELISVQPELQNEDFVITKNQIENALNGISPEAIIIRTLPNTSDKLFGRKRAASGAFSESSTPCDAERSPPSVSNENSSTFVTLL